jgi:predicted dehydrogenase
MLEPVMRIACMLPLISVGVSAFLSRSFHVFRHGLSKYIQCCLHRRRCHKLRYSSGAVESFNSSRKVSFTICVLWLRVLGSRLQVVAIIDPALSRAKDVLDLKREGLASGCYSSTILCPDISAYSGIAPHAIFIGTPPAFRGTILTGRDIEVVASKKFPSAALFVEKPISSALPECVQPLIPHLKGTETFVAVGYMLRYLKGLRPLSKLRDSCSKVDL